MQYSQCFPCAFCRNRQDLAHCTAFCSQLFAKPPVITLLTQNRFNGYDSKGWISLLASERRRNSVICHGVFWPHHKFKFFRIRSSNPDPREKWLQKDSYNRGVVGRGEMKPCLLHWPRENVWKKDIRARKSTANPMDALLFQCIGVSGLGTAQAKFHISGTIFINQPCAIFCEFLQSLPEISLSRCQGFPPC